MKKGFSILELIIAITVFGIISVVTTNAYITSFKAEQRAQLQNSIMLDAKYILDLISKEIENNEIDFEEYFNQCVIQNSCPREDNFNEIDSYPDKDNYVYGINNGLYSWQFINGGTNPVNNEPDGIGGWCQDADGNYNKMPDPTCVTGTIGISEDSPTGINPQIKLENADLTADDSEVANNKNKASSFCAEAYQDFDGKKQNTETKTICPTVLDLNHYTFNELYLINPDKNLKTIIGREQITDEDFAVSMIKLIDKNDLNELPTKVYECDTGYICSNVTKESSNFANSIDKIIDIKTPNRFDLYNYEEGKNIYDDFVPMSPLKVNIKNLSFLIYPDEDPNLAYRENINIYPQVTIILELEPSNTYRLPFFSRNFNLKLQKTVSTYFADLAEIN